MSNDTSSPRAIRNYKFRIHPNKEQERKLLRWLETCRRIYNEALARRKEAWEQENRSVTRMEQQVWLKETKKENDFFKEVHSQVAQEVLFRVERAFDGFFRRVKNGKRLAIPGSRAKAGTSPSRSPSLGMGWAPLSKTAGSNSPRSAWSRSTCTGAYPAPSRPSPSSAIPAAGGTPSFPQKANRV